MATNDLYKVEYRTEQQGIVMSTSMYYWQVTEWLGAGTAAQELTERFLDGTDGAVQFLSRFMGSLANITTVVTRKVLDAGPTGDDFYVAYDQDTPGANVGTMPPTTTLPMTIFGADDPNTPIVFRTFRLGGVAKIMVEGSYSSALLDTFVYDFYQRLFEPKKDPGDEGHWLMAVPTRNPVTKKITGYQGADHIAYNLFPSVQGTRQARLY